MRDEIDYAALRRLVEEGVKRDKRRTRMIMMSINIFLYVLFMIIGWAMILNSSDSAATLGVMIMFSACWGVSLFFQGMTLVADTAAGERQLRQQAMAREIQRIFEQRTSEDAGYPEHKAKRGGRLEVSDDGELVEIVDENDWEAELSEAVCANKTSGGDRA